MRRRRTFQTGFVAGAVAVLLPWGFAGRALAQGAIGQSPSALEQRMQNELSQLQQQLAQLRAENQRHESSAKQKGIPIPQTVIQLRAVQTDLQRSEAILERLPDHYQGYKEAAAKDIYQAIVDIERCKAIDWRIAEHQPH
jgi:hypothetical protein